MKIFIFTGPTLSAADGRKKLDAVFLPPVSQGDVYRATFERPWGIGIIDGYFERMPAVWHKEILWAMARGVHVFGSASMGALRAVELEPYGMEGVGEVFSRFRSGELEDDDEVTVTHGPAEFGFPVASEAMVNIRFTLAAAVQDGVIEPTSRTRLQEIAKGLFYRERSYETILQRARDDGIPTSQLDPFKEWLPSGKVDQKRTDALAMLRLMRERAQCDPEPKQVRFTFEHTDAWELVRRQIDREPLAKSGGTETAPPDAVVDELRLDGETYRQHRSHALIRSLALEAAWHEGMMEVDAVLLRETVETFCREQGLADTAALEVWLQRQGLTHEAFEQLMRDEARVRRILAIHRADLHRAMVDQLQASGVHGDLRTRAESKHAALARHGLDSPSIAHTELSEDELWRWYFTEHLGRSVPDDLGAYARDLDLAGPNALRVAVLREYCFGHLRDGLPEGRYAAAVPREAAASEGT